VEIEPPSRDEPVLGRCRCLIVHVASGATDRCSQFTDSPDSPLCEGCEQAHPQGAEAHGIRITMRGVE
jgi:hypothetical protein